MCKESCKSSQMWMCQSKCPQPKCKRYETESSISNSTGLNMFNVKVLDTASGKRLDRYGLFGRVGRRKPILSKNNMAAQSRLARLDLNYNLLCYNPRSSMNFLLLVIFTDMVTKQNPILTYFYPYIFRMVIMAFRNSEFSFISIII